MQYSVIKCSRHRPFESVCVVRVCEFVALLYMLKRMSRPWYEYRIRSLIVYFNGMFMPPLRQDLGNQLAQHQTKAYSQLSNGTLAHCQWNGCIALLTVELHRSFKSLLGENPLRNYSDVLCNSLATTQWIVPWILQLQNKWLPKDLQVLALQERKSCTSSHWGRESQIKPGDEAAQVKPVRNNSAASLKYTCWISRVAMSSVTRTSILNVTDIHMF